MRASRRRRRPPSARKTRLGATIRVHVDRARSTNAATASKISEKSSMKVDLEPAVVRGFRFAGVSAGLKTVAGALDLGLIVADRPASAAAVFSANRVKAAPVYVTAERVKSGRFQAVVANSGCANSFTGNAGMQLFRDVCGCTPHHFARPPAIVVRRS